MDNILKSNNAEVYFALKKVLLKDIYKTISSLKKLNSSNELINLLNTISLEINNYYLDDSLEYFINMTDEYLQFNYYNCIDNCYVNNVITINRDYSKFIIFKEKSSLENEQFYEFDVLNDYVIEIIRDRSKSRKLTI